MATTKKVPPLGIRLRRPEIKAAVKRAAADDRRTQNSMLEKMLEDWLTERGYLAKRESKGAGKPK